MNRFRTALVSAIALSAAAAFLPLAAAHAQKDTKPAVKAPKVMQASIAAKDKAFGTIAASDAKVKSATDAAKLADAKKLVGKTATFSGTVAKVVEPAGLILINFDLDYKTALTAVVRAKDFAKFPVLKTLEGKKVLVSGKVMEFKGQPEVELVALDDVKIIK